MDVHQRADASSGTTKLLGSEQLGECSRPGQDVVVSREHLDRDLVRTGRDASIVVLAERYRTRTIASLDRRHFGVLRSLDGGYFEVLPRTG